MYKKIAQQLTFGLLASILLPGCTNDQPAFEGQYIGTKGCLCDAARPGTIWYRQGDGMHKIHDGEFGVTAIGIILQSELLFIERDMESIRKYVPMLEQCAEFFDSWRDPEKYVFLINTTYFAASPHHVAIAFRAGKTNRKNLV